MAHEGNMAHRIASLDASCTTCNKERALLYVLQHDAIEEMDKTAAKLNKQITEANDARADAWDQVKIMRADEEANRESLTIRINLFKNHISVLESKVEEFEGTPNAKDLLRQARDECVVARKQITEANDERQEAWNVCSRLRQEADAGRGATAIHMKLLKDRIGELESRVEEFESTDQLRQDLNAADKDLLQKVRVEKDLNKTYYNDQTERLLVKLSEKSEYIEDLESQIAHKHKRIGELETELEEFGDTGIGSGSYQEIHMKSLQDRIAVLRKEVSAALIARQAEWTQAKRAIAERDAALQDLVKVTIDREALKAANNDLSGDLTQTEGRLAEAVAEWNALKIKGIASSDMYEKLIEAKRLLSVREERIHRLEADVVRYQSITGEITSLIESIY